MRWTTCLCTLLFLASLAWPAAAQESAAPERIAWSKDLPTALTSAKDSGRVLMICVNAKTVDGKDVEEAAAKGLREVVYRDARVVKRSCDFVCVLLTKEGGATEYDALRALGVADPIVSPQHLFVSPAGDRILHRQEYWPHGKGDPAVEALLRMMDKAEQNWKALQVPAGPTAKDAGPAPEGGEARTAWIAEQVSRVSGAMADRDRAIEQLIAADKDGDCTNALIALLPVNEKNVSTLWALVRALGRDGLNAAAVPISELLDHKDDSVVANAAVSLEYIGSNDKKVIAALRKLAEKSKDEVIANHAYRALGRCGKADAKVRALLLDQAGSAKSEFASYGPCIGLAYFEGDEKAMRGVEKLLKLIGVPGSRKGGGQNTVKRGVVSWTLASIGDHKSAAFVREELIAGLENVKAFWVQGLTTFWGAVADVCDGKKERLPEVEGGVRMIVQFAKGGDLQRYGAEVRTLDDDARKGRESAGFKPKGDGLLGDGQE